MHAKWRDRLLERQLIDDRENARDARPCCMTMER
jgi:hypothetical protein